MKATDVLRNEHRLVEAVLGAAEEEADRLNAGGEPDIEAIDRIVDFLRNFVDRCHHAKEERHLFPRLEARGMSSRVGPIAVMLSEHEQGRGHIRALASALAAVQRGDARAARAVAEEMRAYAALLRDHIFKEDNVLFEMADRALAEQDQKDLVERFDAVERDEMGPGVHERYHELAHELLKR